MFDIVSVCMPLCHFGPLVFETEEVVKINTDLNFNSKKTFWGVSMIKIISLHYIDIETLITTIDVNAIKVYQNYQFKQECICLKINACEKSPIFPLSTENDFKQHNCFKVVSFLPLCTLKFISKLQNQLIWRKKIGINTMEKKKATRKI